MDFINFHKIIEGVDLYIYKPEKYDFDAYIKILWKKWS
jgi:hypothetical protein